MNSFAQTTEWKTESVDKGKITVKSKISKRTNDETTLPLIEYIVTTTESVSFQKCILTMKDVSKHNQFLDLKSSFIVNKNNDKEYVVYYCFNAPWPFSPTDCVAKMTFDDYKVSKIAVFTLKEAPLLYKATDYKRFNFYNVVYTFKDLGNGKVEITLTAKMSPPVSVPLWLIRNGFPEIGSDIVRKFVKLVK
ncbi:SRPBCC family protein [Flavobacterium luteum]|uniref:START domain-containing protein n=1 Tax=Flavobacterium luteum TaxID=2026654 RepID=A0A7J5AJX0_9FLAO|nr:hypothetical protein [Flavobacterium luteum]KAB1157793.1 hypothetical protein F6464_01535 [Flavobacterium luteum]